MIAQTADVAAPKRSRKQKLIEPVNRLPATVAELPSESVAIVQIPLGEIERHPLNRVISETDPEIIALANSIAEHGQLEPIRVRRLPSGKYQLISGERRYTALVVAGFFAAMARVVDVDDATALKEVAAANSHRQDLDPIERAELMTHLMRPIIEGGSGLTREQAGHIFGLTSESGCKNALRMLKLPPGLKALVKSREVPERVARTLVPYCDVPQLAKVIDEKFAEAVRDEQLEEFLQEADSEGFWWIEQEVEDSLRPIDAKTKRSNAYPAGPQPRLFELTDELRAKLDIVTVPTRAGWEKGRPKMEPREWCTNAKLWDELQAPHIAAINKGKGKPESATKAAKAEGRKLTPAEERAEAKRKAKLADEQLDKFTRDWAYRLLRATISMRSSDESLVALTLPMISTYHHDSAHELRSLADAALVETQCSTFRGGWERGSQHTHGAALKTHRKQGSAILAAYWRLIVWPVSRLISDKAKPHDEVTPAGELPNRLIGIDEGTLDALAELAGVSAETAWHEAARDGSDERRLVSVWLMRHTTAQLKQLGTELGLKLTREKRADLVDELLAAHKCGRPLALPKRIAAVLEPKAKGKRK